MLCVIFWIPHEICVFYARQTKNLTFTLLWKISTFWAEKILHFFLKLSTLDISRHVTYERSYAARAATLPRVPALVITPSVAASRNTAAPPPRAILESIRSDHGRFCRQNNFNEFGTNKTLKCSSWNPLLSPLTKYPLYRVALKFVFGF